MFEIFKVFILGIVEGITEWLPISSTGHLILVDEFVKLGASDAFKEMFNVVVQLDAIMAVVVLYFNKLNPFTLEKTADQKKKLGIKVHTISLWMKVVVACLPAAVLGILFDDWMEAHFHNYIVVSIMLIVYGVLFILVENWNKKNKPSVTDLTNLTYKTALLIGVFQVLSLIPGTSRSGATIIGALLLGVSRYVAAEFTFFLAIPVMFGASGIKLLKFFMEGAGMSGMEIAMLAVGCVVAFVISIIAIKFLMGYIKKNDFKVFGWYRIILGVLVLGYFLLTNA
jgi:undecaprenyl-diphosphatase